MSLLPIIYSSLIIFTVVMTVVLVVSYLSYKAKQRNSTPENSIYDERMNQNAHLFINHPAAYSTQTIQAAPVPVYSQPTRSAHTEQRRPTSATYVYERNDQKRTTRETPSKKRFHVVNNSSKSEFLTSLQPSSIGGFSRTPAAEFNFLNYYSDQKDDKLNSISVDRYKNYR